MASKDQNQVNARLTAIDVKELHINESHNKVSNKTEFNYNLELEHLVNLDGDSVEVNTKVMIGDNDHDIHYGSIKTAIHFQIQNLKQFYNDEQGQLELPPDLLNSLNAIAISTTRGIMHGQFKGTYLHNAVLPLIDLSQFAPDQRNIGKPK